MISRKQDGGACWARWYHAREEHLLALSGEPPRTLCVDQLNLTVCCRYAESLLKNSRINRYLAKYHPNAWRELQKGQMTDLNSVIGEGSDLQLLDALEINDRGEIVGQGALANGNQLVFLLTPCDDDHSDEEGCGHAAGNATAAIENTPAPAWQNPVDTAWLHARFGRNRGLRAWLQK